MVRVIKILWTVLLASVLTGSAYAQSAPDLIAPNIFVRGIQLPQGVRYTASFIKPVENAALQNISVEITLPAEAQFTEMLVSRQVQFHVVRKNRQRQLTLIWQISRLDADQPLDSFSFTLAQPLAAELEYYMQWQTAEGEQRVEDFFEVPSVVVATQAQAQATVDQPGFVTMGDTGVQVSAPAGATLSAQVLPLNFNPPAQYGNIWWCSLLELNGLPPSTTAEVIMPLRRSLAPFTALQLFQQQADGSWAALAGQGVVTADGQYVIYTHPGGIVATGGDAEIQPDALPASEIPVVEEAAPAPADNQQPADNVESPVDNPPAQDAPPPADNTSGDNADNQAAAPPTDNPPVVADNAGDTSASSNAEAPTTVFIKPTLPPPVVTPIIIGAAPTSVPPTQNSISDGTSNTIIVGEATQQSIQPSATNVKNGNATFTADTPFPAAATRLTNITDGSSNTIIIGEATRTPIPDGGVPFLPTNTFAVAPTRIGNITDGTSNTIIIGEATRTPIPDGGVPFLPTNTFAVAPTRISNITDGTSNTIIVSEVTRTPIPDGSVPFLPTNTFAVAPTRIGNITDGTSNTIIIGEVTKTPIPDGSVPFLPTSTAASVPTRIGNITDGTSNTIIIGEITKTPIPDGSVPFLPTNTLGSAPTRISNITDGTSNTISIGELTRTPTTIPLVTAKPNQPTATNVKNENATFVAGTPIPVTPTRIGGISDGTSNTIIVGEKSATPAPIPTIRPTVVVATLPPPVFSPIKGTVTTQPFGAGGARVEILKSPSTVLQCQAGQVNCSVLNRRVGTGLR